ncbi:MAG: Mercuric reductase [Verrucomicrobiota bacterium]|jgi:pyruvate/2-oxoglutarate dehydrogenase complex dihydrolipoamide dehydrogenase (E3) component
MNSAAPFDFDVAVIGGGSAGYAAARATARDGLRTVVIEGGPEVGGLCILRGCMPTKALLYAAEVKHLAEHAATWGLQVPEVRFDFAQVMARKNAMVADFAGYRRQQLESGRFQFLRASARFVDPHTIALDNGQQLTSAHFVLSTGSALAPVPLPQLDAIGYLTSDSVMTLARLPRSLIVLGGGAVAVEFAQFFARFGVRVTLLQRSAHLLRDFDPDAAQVIESVFRREGMEVVTGTRLLDAHAADGLKHITYEHEGKTRTVAAEEIFHGLGRTPNIGGLDLGAAGVTTDPRGRIVTNDRMQTVAPHIFAAGDCAGPHEIVHLAIQQGEIAAHNVLQPQSPRSMNYQLLTSVVFTDPQVACVGLTEAQARANGREFIVASYPFADHGKSLLMEAEDGFVKLLADPRSGEILGGACVGPMGGELIHEIIAAMSKRMTVAELAALPHYHPTLAEIWTYPAEELAALTADH